MLAAIKQVMDAGQDLSRAWDKKQRTIGQDATGNKSYVFIYIKEDEHKEGEFWISHGQSVTDVHKVGNKKALRYTTNLELVLEKYCKKIRVYHRELMDYIFFYFEDDAGVTIADQNYNLTSLPFPQKEHPGIRVFKRYWSVT